MSYKSELQGNNTDLQTILDKVNALPEETVLPELTDPASASDIVLGKEAIDGDGNKMTGTVEEYGDGKVCYIDVAADYTYEGEQPYIVGCLDGRDALIRSQVAVLMPVPTDWMGDATAEDVALGKTFTSAEGFRVVGQAQGGGGLETVNVTLSDGAGAYLRIWYMDGSGEIQNVNTYGSEDITVVKGSIVYLQYGYGMYFIDMSNCTPITSEGSNYGAVYFTGDGYLTVAG